MNKPMVGLTLFFMAGLILGRYLPVPLFLLYSITLTLFGLTLILYLRKKKHLVSYLLFFLIFLVGILYFVHHYFPHSSFHIINFAPSKEKVEIRGKVVNRPQLKERRISFILEAEKITLVSGREKKVKGKIWVNSYFPLQNYDYGDRVRIKGELRLPQGAKNKGEFDWSSYLSYQGIWVEASTGKVERLERRKGNFILYQAYRSRDWMVKLIEHGLPPPHSAVLKGIMLGDKASLPPQVQQSFLRTGTGHILVVSGLHVGLILFLLLTLFKVLSLPSKLASLLIIPLLGYYAFLTGLRAPVLRATLMVTVALIGFLVDRDVPLLVVLFLACLIILILHPLDLFRVSFQLSFVAVGGIIYLTPYLEKGLKRLPLYLRRSLAVSLAAQSSILPLLAFYFHQLPLIGVITNLIIAPLVTVILALGFLSLALGVVSLAAAQWIALSNWLVISLLLKAVSFFTFSGLPFLSRLACLPIKPFCPWLLLVYYSALILSPHLGRR